MKKAPEVDIGPLDIETNYFQFQNIDTYNWKIDMFFISNNRKWSVFSYSDQTL